MQEAPPGLGESGRALWESIAGKFGLEVFEQQLLLQACRSADLLDRLAAQAAAGGLTVTNAKGDVVTAPWISEHRQQSANLARMIASLRIPDEDDQRPQRRGALRRSYGIRGSVA
ncbi:hypothetical protein [Streptomyces asiaticus]|uniref:hypothetical protein n=1 Tax=Streptomyces asiaticus TaxID=114695 RepID=UPI003F670D4C